MTVDPAVLAGGGDARASADAGPLARNAGFSIFLLALTLTSGAAMRMLFSPMQEAAKLELGLSDVQIGLVQGVAAAIPIAALSIPLGWMVDHGRRVTILMALVGVWTIGTLLTAFADSLPVLYIARMLAGMGSTLSVTVAISIAADLSKPEKRGRSLLFLSMGNIFGAAIAFALGGMLFGLLSEPTHKALAGLTPWREVNLLFGIASAVLLLPLLALREPVRREVGQAEAALVPALRILWGRRGFLAPLFVGQISVAMADTAAGVWAAPVLIRTYHQQPAEFAGWMGGVLLFCGLVGSILGGFAADWGQKRGTRGGILIGAVIASLVGVPAALFPIMPGVAGFALMLTALLLAGAVAGLITATTIAVLVPNEVRGVCLGAFIVISSLIGVGLSPVIVTLGSRLLGGEHQLDLSLAITGVVVGVISVVAFFQAMRRAPLSATVA